MEASDSTRQIRLRFASNETEAKSISELETVIVWPSKDDMDDQGYRLLVDFMIKADGKVYRPDRPAAMIIKHFKDTHEAIASFVNSERSPSEADQFIFASLQMEVNEYRRIGGMFGLETSSLVLEAMHDLVVEKQKSKPRMWLAEVEKMEAFKFGLLRLNSRYFAYRRGYHFLIGNKVEAIGRASARVDLSFNLDSFSGAHVIPLNFAHNWEVDRRINVLIGRNGVGKSQTLVSLYVFGDETVPMLARLTIEESRKFPGGDLNEEVFKRLSDEYSNEAISYIRSALLEREASNQAGDTP